MKNSKRNITKRIATFTLLFSFLFSISILSYQQTKNPRVSKSANDFHTIKDYLYSTESNLSTFLHNSDDYRFTEIENNRDYLHFLTCEIPFLNFFQEHSRNRNFSSNFLSNFNYKLYSIPPPLFS